MKTCHIGLPLALAALASVCQAQDAAPVTPYRPSVSSPAQLPAAGQLELELGGLDSKDGANRRASLPYTLKLAFDEQWGVLLGGEAYVTARDEDGIRKRGLGDTLLVLKRAWVLDGASALGVELGAKAPTAREGVGSGRADYSVNGIYSRDLGSVHMDANVNLTRLGAQETGSARIQDGWSASFSTPLTARWGVTGELSGAHRAGVDGSAQALVAAAYSPHPRLTLDLGLAKGLNRASPDWSIFTGVVLPLARLW